MIDDAITWVEDEDFRYLGYKTYGRRVLSGSNDEAARTKVNFAIKSACTLINYMSGDLHIEARTVRDTSGYKDEDRECFCKGPEGAWYQPAEPDGPHYISTNTNSFRIKPLKLMKAVLRRQIVRRIAPGLIGDWFVTQTRPK